MKDEISFVIFSNTGTVKKGAVSKMSVRWIGFGLMICLLFTTFVLFDYVNLKKNYINILEYKVKFDEQANEIISHRMSVQKFAHEINALKSRLVELDNFEKKIRVIANLENSSDQGSFFGIGGSIPQDLETQIPLMEKHNSLVREINEQTPQLEIESKKQLKRFESLLTYFKDQRDIFSSTPTIRPAKGWTTSPFGYRTSPYTGMREFHRGLDIANRIGTPIVATADGTVTTVSFKTFRGRFMVVDHGHGMVTTYAHIQKALKKPGEAVKRGDTIALVGNTGRSTGPHLHYEVFLNGIPVNPVKYILN